ncbi:streptothricin hydrolase [Variibacter gotjawalensis]|uniref:Streptothricin hydrolase n=1 Tax=Variibacter gotjawalensis TaxID=1333996 RepID=A0A0S3PVK2_9BRAD|nr:cysteine hydrolase family protein [Variibacter gotjawalensis]NIK45731.1 nicotinamidase-related amidase [Variibacter gotjawalensis]RZS47655.1 nicotinamidase-related amidase [Variibacter gotjawalensis]BAT59908.1 streptothricin hydrolase [Variibacter gotjawalensis]
MRPKTLLELAGAATPSKLENTAVIVIDAQREYVDGKLPLPGVKDALTEIAALLAAARAVGAPVFHIQHKGRAGGAFDPGGPGFEIAPQAAPQDGEVVIEKGLPNSFAGTTLKEALEKTGRKELTLAGFMTHMCVEATARAALDLGYKSTVVASTTVTRDLPDPVSGETITAADLKRASLTALNDRFAVVVPDLNAVK